jgi:hypothetical protein
MVLVIFLRKLSYATENSRLRLLFRRSTRLGISCRCGLTPSIVASAFLVSRWQSSFFQSLSSFSSSSQNIDTDRAQNLFLMAHNPDSVIYLAPGYHQLTMQSGEISPWLPSGQKSGNNIGFD